MKKNSNTLSLIAIKFTPRKYRRWEYCYKKTYVLGYLISKCPSPFSSLDKLNLKFKPSDSTEIPKNYIYFYYSKEMLQIAWLLTV